MSELEQLNPNISKLSADVQEMDSDNKASWAAMSECLKFLEDKQLRKQSELEEEFYEHDRKAKDTEVKLFTTLSRGHGPAGTPVIPEVESHVPIQSKDLKWEYEALKDSVSWFKLPPRYRMNDSKAGINSKDCEQAAVLVRSARFVETSFKLLFEVQKSWGNFTKVAELMDGVLLSSTAHMHYLQEEHNSLYVAGQYGGHAKSVFKSLQRNSSNLQPEDIEDLKITVSFLPVQQVSSQQNTFNRGFCQIHGGYRGRDFRGRGRGQFNHFGGGPGYQQRFIPPIREENQGDDNNTM